MLSQRPAATGTSMSTREGKKLPDARGAAGDAQPPAPPHRAAAPATTRSAGEGKKLPASRAATAASKLFGARTSPAAFSQLEFQMRSSASSGVAAGGSTAGI